MIDPTCSNHIALLVCGFTFIFQIIHFFLILACIIVYATGGEVRFILNSTITWTYFVLVMIGLSLIAFVHDRLVMKRARSMVHVVNINDVTDMDNVMDIVDVDTIHIV